MSDWQEWQNELHEPPKFAPPRPAPVDVETARHLWWGTAGLGVVQLIATMFTVFGDRVTYAAQLVADVKTQDSTALLTTDSAMTYLTVGLIIFFVIGAAFTALILRIVDRMRHGKLWARVVLNILGAVLIVTAVPNLFALGSTTGPSTLLLGAVSIVQGLLAAGAIVLMHRKESNEYFMAGLQRRP